jgi:SARP family transcriptional regulator, regulator of embCAB operon
MHSVANIYAPSSNGMLSRRFRRDAHRVLLLGGFGVVCDARSVALPSGSQRLLVYLALSARPVRRSFVAGVLWPDMSERRAHANLRAALARLNARAPVIRADSLEVGLADAVGVDFEDAREIAEQLLEPAAESHPDEAARAVPVLSEELLPGWYDDWVLLEAENWRQLRLHGLETAADVLAVAERWGEAIRAAEAAVHADPLRESARAALMRVHLAEGNQSEALREFDCYRRLLHDQLGLEPTPRLTELLPARLPR